MPQTMQAVRRGPIVVIGSVNMDLVCRTQRLPAAGETILGGDLMTIPGGKGANQAVAAARLGAKVHLVARVGDDDFGSRLLSGLKRHGVGTRHVTVTEGVSSGCALILVDAKGENSIVVAPGANHRLTPADIDAAEGLLARASVAVLQLEIPPRTVDHAIAACRRLGVFTILDPAPAPAGGLSREMYRVDLLTPNQHEAVALLSRQRMGRLGRTRREDAKQIGAELLWRGPSCVVMKLGSKGAMVQTRDGLVEHIRAFKVDVVDTTAAGDAFTGALAVALSEGRSLSEAAVFANAAGALCCTGFGAQPSLPSRDAVERMLAQGQ